MKLALKERDIRALKFGLLFVLPVLAFRLVAVPFASSWLQREEQIATEQSLHDREAEVIAAMAHNSELRRSVAGQLAAGYRRVFTSDQPNLAAAGALAYIDSVAQLTRVEVLHSAGRDLTAEGPVLTSLTIDFAGTSDFEGLIAFMTRLESGGVLVRIPTFSIEAPVAQQEATDVQTLTYKTSIRMFFAKPGVGL